MSNRRIRPQGAEETPHACTLAKRGSGVNDSPQPAKNIFNPEDGFQVAERWYAAFHKNAEACRGYYFPSGLREAFGALPQAQQGDFIDLIGSLFVDWRVVGGWPIPGKKNLRESISLGRMAPEEQDRWCAETCPEDQDDGDMRAETVQVASDTELDMLGVAVARLDEIMSALDSVQAVLRAIKLLTSDETVRGLATHVSDVLSYQFCSVDDLVTDLTAYCRKGVDRG